MKRAHRRQVLSVDRDIGPQAERVRAGDRQERARMPSHPGHDSPVVEADDQVALHVHLAPPTFDDAHDIGFIATHRHEVDHRHHAALGLERRLQDQAVISVSTVDPTDGRFGADPPAAVLPLAQQGREASPGVESRETSPIDRSVAADKRRCLSVADEGVTLDREGHGWTSVWWRVRPAQVRSDSRL